MADPLEQEALGRVLQSEAGSHTLAERIAIGWAVRNAVRRSGGTIRSKIYPWGKQGVRLGPNLPRRPWSSREEANAENAALAGAILDGKYPDPVGGAHRYFEPAVQDKLVGKDPRYQYSAKGIRSKWLAEGMELYATVGRWEFYGPKRKSGGGGALLALLGLAVGAWRFLR